MRPSRSAYSRRVLEAIPFASEHAGDVRHSEEAARAMPMTFIGFRPASDLGSVHKAQIDQLFFKHYAEPLIEFLGDDDARHKLSWARLHDVRQANYGYLSLETGVRCSVRRMRA